MRRSTLVRIVVSTVVASLMLVSIACETMDDGHGKRRIARLTLPYAIPEVAIGIRLEQRQERTEVIVSPYRALVMVGQKVEWYSPDGPMRLEFQEPTLYCCDQRAPELRPRCTERRTYCYVDVPENQPYGKYPYFVYVERDGREYVRNQPVMDIRG